MAGAGEWVQRAGFWKCRRNGGATYVLVVTVAEGLAHELAHPVVILTVLGLQTGDYERHVVVLCSCEAAYKCSGKYIEVCGWMLLECYV